MNCFEIVLKRQKNREKKAGNGPNKKWLQIENKLNPMNSICKLIKYCVSILAWIVFPLLITLTFFRIDFLLLSALDRFLGIEQRQSEREKKKKLTKRKRERKEKKLLSKSVYGQQPSRRGHSFDSQERRNQNKISEKKLFRKQFSSKKNLCERSQKKIQS